MYKKNNEDSVMIDSVMITIHAEESRDPLGKNEENKNQHEPKNEESHDPLGKKETLEMSEVNNNKQVHYKVVHKQRNNSSYAPRPRRKTRSFPIENKTRKNTLEASRHSEKTPQNGNGTPPTKSKKNNDQEQNKKTQNIVKFSNTMKDESKETSDISEYEDQIHWDLGCIRVPKDCIVYFSQMIIIGCVISVSLYKLSTENDRLEFWASLLSGSVGYILPQPTLKKKK